jgi:HlyD family secretion protein
VYVPETGRLEERTVTTGLSNWQYTEVTAGVRAGERVVLSLERPGVKGGAKARPESENSPGP